MLVDTTFRTGAQDYQRIEIHHLGEHIVRVDIRRDGYPQQSFARVRILAATKQWTTLVTAPCLTGTPRHPDRGGCSGYPRRFAASPHNCANAPSAS